METIQIHVQDTMFALITTYLKLHSRNYLVDFNLMWSSADRVVVVDDVTFPINRKMLGEEHEVPGVNLMFHDEVAPHGNMNPQLLRALMRIHVYIETTVGNTVADNRTLLKIQRLIDESLVTLGCVVVDFYSQPAVIIPKTIVSWNLAIPTVDRWQELTDLESRPYLHRARELQLTYRDAFIVVA